MDIQLDDMLEELGLAGEQLTAMGAAEGSAGNLSMWARDLDPGARFPARGLIDLPLPVPALAGGWIAVTGSRQRLRDIARKPERALCLLRIDQHGTHARLHGAEDARPTSEVNSHLAIHAAVVARDDLGLHAVAHAQPIHLTFLSHVARYAGQRTLNRALLRWQPESIMVFGDGIATLPFEVPGSPEQMAATADAMLRHQAVVWQQHGIVTRAEHITRAADLIEYVEAGARYEYMNLQAGEPSAGISDEHIRQICARIGIEQSIF